MVSIIIVNWNGERLLTFCLNSIKAQTYRDFEIILVDNASKDNSLELVRSSFPEVKIIGLQENRGFTGGNNIGFKASAGEYICLVNNDVTLDCRWLEYLVRAMDALPEVGICASKVLIAGTCRINACGDGMTTAGMGYQIGCAEPQEKYISGRYVFGGYGAAVMFRSRMIEEIGFLDDDFFLIHEEDDLNFRAQLVGWKCIFVPEAVAYHRVYTTVGRGSELAVYHISRNSEWVWIKNMPGCLMLRYLHHKIIQELSALFFFLGIGQIAPYVKGKIDAARGMHSMLRKRKVVQSLRKVSCAYIEHMLISEWKVIPIAVKRVFHTYFS